VFHAREILCWGRLSYNTLQGTDRCGLELFARALEAAHGEGGGEASYGCEK
jgi:hypothetical protein